MKFRLKEKIFNTKDKDLKKKLKKEGNKRKNN